MPEAAATTGNFADFKLVKTRSTAQLIIELPIESADAALAALGGIPQPGQERPVAVARLETSVVKQQLKDSVELERKKSLAQQAGALCNDARFRAFLAECHGFPIGEVSAEKYAPSFVRDLCKVQSRSEFDTDPEAAERWRALHGQYLAWLQT